MTVDLPDDPKAWRREHFPYRTGVPTRWADDDFYGHVNNVVHYEIFDTVVNGWLMRTTGVDIRKLPAIGLVVETSCRYFAELNFPEIVESALALEKLGRTSVVYRLALFKEGRDEPVATGRFVHVYVDAASRATTPVPEVVTAALATLA